MKQLLYWLIGNGKGKYIFYWLLGEKAGRVLVGTWNWLWGIPVESGGKVALEVAQESLESMQQSVAELTESVASVIGAYEDAAIQYSQKKQELGDILRQAELAFKRGNDEAARLALTKAISLENLLPKMAARVEQAEKVVIAAKEKLRREREKLELYKHEIANLKSIHKINESLAKITDFDSQLNLGSAREQFDTAQDAIQGRYLKENAHAELSEDPTEQLQIDLNNLVLEDEVSQRLAQLKDNTKEF